MSEEKSTNTSTDYEIDNPDFRFYILPLAVLLFLVFVVLLASYLNYNTYFFKINSNKLELWHGDFAPMGFQRCKDFDPIAVEGHDFSKIVHRMYRGKEHAYGVLYSMFIAEAEEELNNGCDADLKKVDHSIELADKFFPFCYWINPDYSRSRFDISWKKVETIKELLSAAYKDSLEHMDRVKGLGLIKEAKIEEKEKEAKDWLKEHPFSP